MIMIGWGSWLGLWLLALLVEVCESCSSGVPVSVYETEVGS